MPSRAIDPRITEHRNPRSADIDLASPIEIVDIMNAEDRGVPDAVATQREEIARGITLIERAFRSGGRLFYAGAGTSGRLGILDASECPPTFGSDPELVQGIIAGGTEAVFRAQEGAEDLPENGARAVEEHGVRAGDVIIGIAASGTTPFVRGALTRAKALGAATGLIACTPIEEAFAATLDLTIIPVTGPEVVTGSTRLKAGTATKLVLNMLTTGAMIRVGKTFGNLMIDLKATNLKLVDRSQRILMEVCGVTRDEAQALMLDAGGRVKLAIVMHALGVSAERASEALDAGDGLIRRVIGGDPPPVTG
ncbi:MAG: N-acetylmuramic acid 6-phosphate etherase [Gemmatimonadota bacterium]